MLVWFDGFNNTVSSDIARVLLKPTRYNATDRQVNDARATYTFAYACWQVSFFYNLDLYCAIFLQLEVSQERIYRVTAELNIHKRYLSTILLKFIQSPQTRAAYTP
jgi:hypothetical protein